MKVYMHLSNMQLTACLAKGAETRQLPDVWNTFMNARSHVMYLEKTGASVVSPWGDQKPLVVQSVKGFSMPSSRTRAKMLWYCRCSRYASALLTSFLGQA